MSDAIMPFVLKPGAMSWDDLRIIWESWCPITLPEADYQNVQRGADTVSDIVASGKTVYGVNTGFGKLASYAIDSHQLEELQEKLILSHACGVGERLSDPVVRLILVTKIASLARGASGVRPALIEALIEAHNAGLVPEIPGQGSVGASGDLAPLAHMVAALMGQGYMWLDGTRMDAADALEKAGVTPLTLTAKEGLALINGTQVSTALAISALFKAEHLFDGALVAGAMSIDAALASDSPFDARIHELRGQPGQIEVAATLRAFRAGSEIPESHKDCGKVQDPYCLRCMPQVMGAVKQQLDHARQVLLIEANAVTDNPLVFPDTGEVLSGGNFHAEPVAMVADQMAVAIAEIGNLSERRVAMLTDASISGLPAFLIEKPGLNSGFMMAHVTAAALCSENKILSHPASVDSIPTSANQEDHVSMATHAARRLTQMMANTQAIVAIELLAASQGIEFHRPLKSAPVLEDVLADIRKRVPRLTEDRLFAPDIEEVVDMLRTGVIERQPD
ncbi:MAG: histidine ammonia-lyase [Alphaproteobacteria bacterium]